MTTSHDVTWVPAQTVGGDADAAAKLLPMISDDWPIEPFANRSMAAMWIRDRNHRAGLPAKHVAAPRRRNLTDEDPTVVRDGPR